MRHAAIGFVLAATWFGAGTVAAQGPGTKRRPPSKAGPSRPGQPPAPTRPDAKPDAKELVRRLMAGNSEGVDTKTRLVLKYGTDVGFQPGAQDALPIGPDYLTASDGQVVALYDVIRREVIVATPSGIRSRFLARPVDALLITSAGEVAVLDGARGRLLRYTERGTLRGELQLPTQLASGERIELEGTVLLAVNASGDRRELAQIVGGRLLPPTRTRSVSPPVSLRARGNALQIGSESIEIPQATRVAGRLLGGRPPWVEVQILRSSSRPGLEVLRRALRRGAVVALPVGERSYVPAMDVAASPSGELVYLEPREGEVHVVWVRVP